MSFGISGSESASQMLGADVVVAHINGFQGFATDYNITSLAPVYQSIEFPSYFDRIYNSICSVYKYWVKTKEFAGMTLSVD